jgi:ATP-dependent helicase/nuclease subunit B
MNVFQIDSSEDFLKILVDGILSKFGSENLSELLVILPSQRSCRLLEKKLMDSSTKDSFILPKIIPIGSLESNLEFEIYDDLKNIPQSMGVVEAKFLLSNLIKKEALKKRKLSQEELLDISAGLLRLISKFEKEDKDLSLIKNTMLGDIPEHIENIIDYLKLVSTSWPKQLSTINKSTTITRRNIFIKTLSRKWSANPPRYPVIISGSTGSFNTTKLLIKAISKLPNGNVVLQGTGDIKEPISETDPTFQLSQLLDYLDLKPSQISNWTTYPKQENLLANILLNKQTESIEIGNVEYIECDSSREEALLISIKIRELLEKKHTNIGVVTTNALLRYKVKNLLQIWNIDAELSDGISLTSTEHFIFLMNIFESAYRNFSPESLLNLIKHNLCSIFPNEVASRLEIQYLRGLRKYKDLKHLISLIKEDEELKDTLENLVSCYEKLNTLLRNKYIPIKDILSTLLALSDTLSDNINIWESEIGSNIFESLQNLLNDLPSTKIYIGEFSNIFKSLISEQNIFATKQNEVKVHILTPIESRLLDFDYLILAGLNEKNWPEHPEIDPWLSAGSYTNLGLPSKKIKIGQSARDLMLLLQNKNILMTRSINENNSPQIASRWITKIEIWAQNTGILGQIKPPQHYLKDWVRNLYTPTDFTIPMRPAPRPPVELRPINLSVTQIEKLMRDPYSVYAKKILKLKPLDPIDKKPNQLEFGNYVHYALDIFNKSPDDLLNIWEKIMKIHNPVATKIWTPRFKKIAAWVSEYETKVRKSHSIETEIKFSVKVGENLTLTAKADRVERSLSGNKVNIIDFKTGSIPSQIDIKNGFSPQLTLEAFLIKQNSPSVEIENMFYIQLGSGKKIGHTTKVQGDINEILETTQRGVQELVSIYMDPNTPYLACPKPEKSPTYNEFEHLERLDENM